MTAVSPVRAAIAVDVPQNRTFDAFAGALGRWWPLGYTYAQAGLDTAVIEPRVGGLWFERDLSGKETAWGEVRAWEPPSRLVLSWSPNPERSATTEVEVRFTALAPGHTRVELEHRGWERLGDLAAEIRDNYREGWPGVLGSFAATAMAVRPGRTG
jgi:uncharacterized protein YndB with AHSA1/START domain